MNLTTSLPHLALAAIPELGLVLQLASTGAAVGAAIALRARRRDPDADTWRITTAWSCVGLVVGCLLVVLSAAGVSG